jgi:transcriptional regulator GlxA family with amidase domain
LSRDRLANFRRFVFIPLPSFTLVSLTCAIEVLRMANHLLGTGTYEWTVVSPDGGWIESSNGLAIDTIPMQDVVNADVVFVIGGTGVHNATTPEHLATLRQYSRSGCVMGSLCTGTFALASAGLLKNYTCSSHWESVSALTEAFPQTRFVQDLFVIDRDRITCAGGIASIDLMLKLVAAGNGDSLAQAIARQYLHDTIRQGDATQRSLSSHAQRPGLQLLRAVVTLMEETIEDPLPRQALAGRCGLSQRKLQRLFDTHFGQTPTQYYIYLRLERARQLLIQTKMPLLAIATACGFRSAAQFSKRYRDAYGIPPTKQRPGLRRLNNDLNV